MTDSVRFLGRRCARDLRRKLGLCPICRDGVDHTCEPCLMCGGTSRTKPEEGPSINDLEHFKRKPWPDADLRGSGS